MPCNVVKTESGFALVCGGRRAKRCTYCNRPAPFLCDFPVIRKGRKATCDAALCEACAQKGDNPDYDFCRPHFPLAKAAAERRKVRANGTGG